MLIKIPRKRRNVSSYYFLDGIKSLDYHIDDFHYDNNREMDSKVEENVMDDYLEACTVDVLDKGLYYPGNEMDTQDHEKEDRQDLIIIKATMKDDSEEMILSNTELVYLLSDLGKTIEVIKY